MARDARERGRIIRPRPHAPGRYSSAAMSVAIAFGSTCGP